MAFWDRFLIQAPKVTSEVKAQYAPPLMTDSFSYFTPQVFTKVDREIAMSIPAIVRCRNLIAGTIASIPLHL